MSQNSPTGPAAQPDTPLTTHRPSTAARSIFRGLILLTIGGLLVFLFQETRILWSEYQALSHQLFRVRQTAVVGYPGITPQYSRAQKPANWFHEEGTVTLLWSGWRPNVGHEWFRIGKGEINRAHISEPMGRDLTRAIDVPIVERGGTNGTYWPRIPDDADVAGPHLGGVDTAYPLLLLQNVMVVNDLIAEKPFVVVTNPWASAEEKTAVYEPVVDGARITLGSSGYIHQGRPLLYDRGTESLWLADLDGLKAVAGAYRGRTLRVVARPVPVSWSRWRSEHPRGRLVVGADRCKNPPRS
jgi:hypothetical protein